MKRPQIFFYVFFTILAIGLPSSRAEGGMRAGAAERELAGAGQEFAPAHAAMTIFVVEIENARVDRLVMLRLDPPA